MKSLFLTNSPVEKYVFLHVAQFPCRKGFGCTDALLAIYQHIQKSLDAGMEASIVQLDCSTALDRVRHSGLLIRVKSIGGGGSLLSI